METFDTDNLTAFVQRTGNVLVHLLDRCNLHCRHCYLDAHENGTRMLPLELVKRTIDEANQLGIKSVQFSGGEPLLYPHIADVLQSATGKSFSLAVSTNGTLIDDESAKLLSESNARIVTSIDGPEEYHDRFRGKKGSFKKTVDGVARLVSRGVPVKIVTTVCDDSLKYIDWCADLAYEMNVNNLQFQPLESVGRGEEIAGQRLPPEKLTDLFIQLNDLAAFYSQKGLQITMTYKSRDFMIAHPCTAFVCNGKNCHRGVEKELKKIVIREDGSILPELVDIDRQFAIGNLFDNTLTNSLLQYLIEGYPRFDRFCREVYYSTVPNNPSPLIPWNEILSGKSRKTRGQDIESTHEASSLASTA